MWRKKGRADYIGGDDNNILMSEDETRCFSVTAGRESAEVCEERSSIRDYTLPALIWRFARPLLILLLSLALVIYVGFNVYGYVKGNYFDPAGSNASVVKTVQIKPGSSLSTIATKLYEEGLIRNKFVFQMYADFNDMGSSLKAGTYKLSPAMTMDDIIDRLSAGDGGRRVVNILLTEGMTIEDMAQTLMDKGIFDASEKQEFLSLCKDPGAFDNYGFIEAVKETEDVSQRKYALEGYVFPDTYEIYLDAKPEDVIRKLLTRFDVIFKLEYEDRAEALGMTIDEVVALASLIEWEGLPNDFKKVSAVFHNRLEKKMPLQSGATLRYVTGLKKLFYTAQELEIDSPYNTEKNLGLPLGPVCNPGNQAIMAALYPDEQYIADKYYYFSNKAPDSGELVFAKTLKEHHKNVEAYNELAAQASASPDPS